MIKVYCKDCCWFKKAPYEVNLTGCWHSDNMKITQKEAFLDQQNQPGNHRKINLRGDCQQYEAAPARLSLLQRLLRRGA